LRRIPLLLFLAASPLGAQSVDSVAAPTPAADSLAIAQVALERFLAVRGDRPTEVWPQFVCTRMAGEERWCTPSAANRVAPVLERLAAGLEVAVARSGKVPACGGSTSDSRGLQLRVASLRIAGDSAEVGVAVWCASTGGRFSSDGCRYHLVRVQEQWAIRPGAPVRCFAG
jgi:hypothetical protein